MIRKIDISTGIINTIAGNGERGFSGDGGPATDASLNTPRGVDLDPAGNIYVAEFSNGRIRKIDTSGIITTYAGGISGGDRGTLIPVLADGGPATDARLNGSTGVAVDNLGNVYIADRGNKRIRKVDTAGIITTVLGDFVGDGGLATDAALWSPNGVFITNNGDIYIADRQNHEVRKVDSSTGIITSVVGTGGYVLNPDGTLARSPDGTLATAAGVRSPRWVWVTAAGDILFSDDGIVRKVDAGDGTISTLAGATPPAEGLEFRGDGGPALDAAVFAWDIFVDGADNIYVAEDARVRKVDTSTGMIGTVAGTGERGYSGDGGPATEAMIGVVRHLFIDSDGHLYLADQTNNRIRKVDGSTGIITTVAGNGSGGADGDDGPATDARINSPWGVAVDDGGNIFIAGLNSQRIRKVDGTTGIITTVAGGSTRQMYAGDGGPATDTTIWSPIDVSLDSQGNLYLSEISGHRVRKVEGIAVPTTIGVGVFSGPVFAPQPDVPDPPVFTAADIFPADNATGVPRTITLRGPATDADADSLTYKVFVGSSADSLVEVAQGLTEGTFTLQGEFLETLFWQMEVTDGTHTVLSGIRQFTIQDDTSPPVLSKVDAVDIAVDGATIKWTANKLSNSRVVYGEQADLSDSTAAPVGADMVLNHAVELTGLTAATTYYYQASSANAAGNVGKSDILNFNTLSAPDIKAPGFTVGPLVESIADSSAAVRWEADELVVGAVTVTGVGVDSSTALSLDHLVFLVGLDPSTAYTVTVSISDGAGNETVSSAIPFTTKAAPDTKAPVFLQLPDVSVTHIAASVSWRVDEPSQSRVLYGLQESNLSNTVDAGVAGLFNTVDLLDLEPGTDYYYRVESEDQAGNILSSPVLTFSTLAQPDVKAPQVVEGPTSEGITQDQATIAWRTDESAFSRVTYDSLAISIGSDRTLQSTAPSQAHSHRLSGLAAATTYQYRLVSIDGAGNADTSDVNTFQTLAAPDTQAPALTSQPAITNLNFDGVTVEWKTNEASSTEATATPIDTTGLDPVVRLLPALVKNHQVFLGGLSSNTTYQVVIQSKDGAGNLLQVTLPNVTTLAQPDTTPPEITGPPAVLQVTDTRAQIVWETNEPTDGFVEVDSLVNMSTLQRVGSTAPSRSHNVTLTNLVPDKTYHYRVSSRDGSGNGPTFSPEDRTLLFKTLAAPDVTAPVLLWGPVAVSPGETSVQIQWATSEPADARVRYALDPANLSDGTSVFEAALKQVHEINLTGLEPDSTYHYEILSTDGSKNGPTVSPVKTFNTLAAPDTQAPVVTSGPSVLDATSNSALIGWTTDEPSNSEVEISGGLTSRSESVVFHQVRVTGLAPETNYTLRVHSTDAAGNKVSQDGLDFKTKRVPDNNPPIILEGPSVTYASDVQATVSWETDESSYSKVVFGPVESFVDNPQPPVTNNLLSTFHSVTVTGLQVGTRYLFRVISQDPSGNQVVAGTLQGFVAKPGVVTKLVQPPGGDGGFTTATVPDTQQPVILGGPYVVSATANSLTLEWKTDESSDSGANFGVGDLNSRIEQGQDVGDHKLTLTNLSPGQSYQYQIESTDPAGNGPVRSQVYLAKTAAAGDVTPPRIVAAAKVIYKTERAATIAWETDEAAASFLAFGTEALDNQKALPDFVTRHQITLTNLSASTEYRYRVRATDAAGNGPTQGQELTFTTEAQPDIEAPTLVGEPGAVAVTDETALIRWETNELSDSAVKYAGGEGLSSSDLGLVTGSARDVTKHEVALTNLTPGTSYTFLVESIDRSDNGPVSSNPITFTTAQGKDETPPGVPQGVLARGTGGSLIITWQPVADEDVAGYDVLRAAGTGDLAPVATLVPDAIYKDDGLDSEITYRYAIRAVDRASNAGELSDPVEASSDGSGLLAAPVAVGLTGDEDQPLLTVTNVEGALSYTFQVASDEGFTKIVTSVSGLEPGSSGETAWQVDQKLVGGVYYWRAWVFDGIFDGAFMIPAEFMIEGSEPNPDFNGDGEVGFPDFLLFASGFGAKSGEERYDAKLDLDSSGDIGFSDFLTFASAFGKPVGKQTLSKPVDLSRPGANEKAVLELMPRAGNRPDEVVVQVRVADAERVGAYQLKLSYDDSRLELLTATTGSTPQFSVPVPEANSLAIQIARENGEMLLAEVFEVGAESEGELLTLTFRLNDPTLTGWVDISEVFLADDALRINSVADARLDGLRALPTDYALSPNRPNPFNPETVIPYQMPEVGDVSLIVYNVLGQHVRELLRTHQTPGFYNVTWDGKDNGGRPVSSGIYLIRMEANAFVQIQKMLLLK